MKILIAEESANSREALAEFFRGQGHQVTVAQDGVLARQCLDAETFDAVVVHLNLPRGGASEVVQETLAGNPQAVAVVVTAFGDGFQQVARSPGANVFLLQKPFRATQILRLIQEGRVNRPLKDGSSSERIDIGRTLMQYGAHRTGLDPKL